MDPISLMAIGAVVSASGGLGALIRKAAQAIGAERNLKRQTSKEKLDQMLQDLPEQPGPEGAEKIRLEITSLVKNMEQLPDKDRKLLLDGLEQSSKLGQQRYALKLYDELMDGELAKNA
jgi:hypothetical protein